MSRRHVILFQARFADLVESGAKLQTIRPWRMLPVEVGDVVDLRAWTGKPYRSKQRRLRESVVNEQKPASVIVTVTPRLTDRMLYLGYGSEPLDGLALSAFAVADGFENEAAMFDFFARFYAKPTPHGTFLNFHGQLIGWQP